MPRLSLVLSIIALLGLAGGVPATAAQFYPSIRQTVLNERPSDPAKYRIQNEVVIFDIWKYFDQAGIKNRSQRADVVYLVTSLQGIVNRSRPRLYLYAALDLFDIETRHYYDPDSYKKPVTELDRFWMNEFKHKG